ncbi:MAG: hypothetical protein K0R99_4906 [Microbacterium sp.]|jgi:hypothetical protein|uniref:hypothetical protein n=1 Tax=Microbacterium sp. TaxID=51671 RepID=UPI002622775B|nr:hypothetical protein [Microbacterium sp.]MDF2563460.1 hypothetical protein [Microbacterium sp.]
MSQDAAIWQLTVASANALTGARFSSVAVNGAVNALVEGLDGPFLRELAGMSRSARGEDIRDMLENALADVGVTPPMSVDEANIIRLRVMAIEALLGRTSVRSLTSWAHDVIGHEGTDAAQHIVMLDDDLDLDLAQSGAAAEIDARGTIETFLAESKHLVGRFVAAPERTSRAVQAPSPEPLTAAED